MAQSATSVTGSGGGGNPTPPTKLSYVGNRPPLDPGQAVVDDGIPYWITSGVLNNFMSLNETASTEANSLRVVFAAKTAAANTVSAVLGGGISVDHEGKGNETLFTQTYSGAIYAPIPLQTVGCGPALPTPAVGTASMPTPNATHASYVGGLVPTLASVAPASVAHAVGTTSITLTGTNYGPSTKVYIDGIIQSVNAYTATTLTVTNAQNLAVAGTRSIVVSNGFNGPTTAPLTWTFT